MAITKRAFWDPNTGQEFVAAVKTHDDILVEIVKYLENIEKRVAALEQAYMEDKLLGKTEDPGTIES